jgi:hypothetical protein
MSDYMEYYEFYKKHWERSLSEKTSDMQKEIETLRAENARYRKALEFGLNKMMPEIKAQKGCWPGEIDDFEDRAREALKGEQA